MSKQEHLFDEGDHPSSSHELFAIKGFERALKDRHIPNLYWVFEPELVEAIAAFAVAGRLGTFGLEIGFGEQPSKVRNIDAHMLWILAENQVSDVWSAKENITRYWLPETDGSEEASALAPILAVVLNVTEVLYKAAAIIVMRNPRRDMIPASSTLQAGQHLHLIIDSEHATIELELYRTTLYKKGYDGSKLLPVSPPRFSMHRAGNMLSYEFVVQG